MEKLVSVVIPTFNRREILKKTLLSLNNQTSRDFEVVVADDGSTDGTGEMIKELKTTYPIKHCRHENAGRSAARNMGIQNSIGKFILFIDDHIIADRKLIEEHINCHKKLRFTKIAVVRGRVEYIDDPKDAPRDTKYIPEAKIRRPLNEQNPLVMFYTNNISVRKEALIKVGGFDEDFKEYGFQDQELGYRIRKAGYKYRFDPNAVGYIFSFASTIISDNRFDKFRQAGRSAVIFYRKHPAYSFFHVGVNPINTMIYLILSLDNWWVRLAKYNLNRSLATNNLKAVKRSEDRLKYYNFLLGVHEALFNRKRKDNKRNILLVSHDSNLSGAPISLSLLAKNLDKKKYNVIFTVPKDGPIVKRVRDMGIEVIVTGRFFQTFWIYRIIKNRNIDIVHANTIITTYAAMAAKIAGKPLIWHIREDIKRRPLLLRSIGMMADKVICISEEIRSNIGNLIPQNKLAVINNGIDLDAYKIPSNPEKKRSELGIGANSMLIGTIGSIEERKGTVYFLEAASLVKKSYLDAKFVIVGDPLPGDKHYQRKMAVLSDELGIRDNIVFTGSRPDAFEILAAFDIFTLPTLWEGTSRVILEAFALSKPVVATTAGALPEMINNNENGLLVPPKDALKLADAIIRLIKDSSLRKQLGESGRKSVEKDFTIRKHVDKVESVYQEILQGLE